MTTAITAPGLIQRNPCRAFGLAQYSTAIMMQTKMNSTGHLAMSHAVTAAEPMPSTWPTCWARPPVTTTITAETTSNTMRTTVTPSRIGNVFQAGRPSGTS
jgi:hypothetical protein